jgi:hypothetical protein
VWCANLFLSHTNTSALLCSALAMWTLGCLVELPFSGWDRAQDGTLEDGGLISW